MALPWQLLVLSVPLSCKRCFIARYEGEEQNFMSMFIWIENLLVCDYNLGGGADHALLRILEGVFWRKGIVTIILAHGFWGGETT